MSCPKKCSKINASWARAKKGQIENGLPSPGGEAAKGTANCSRPHGRRSGRDPQHVAHTFHPWKKTRFQPDNSDFKYRLRRMDMPLVGQP